MVNCVKNFFIILFFLTFYISVNLKAQIKKVKLKGTTVNRESSVLYLFPYTTSRVSYDKKIEIPIKNNSFEYVLDVESMLAYKFIFKDELDNGAYDEIIFFPDTNEVKFKLYDMGNNNKNEIFGGQLNTFIKTFNNYKESRFKLYQDGLFLESKILKDKNEYRSESYNIALEAFKKAKSDFDKKINSSDEYYKSLDLFDKIQNSEEGKTAQGQNIDNKIDSLNQVILKWKYEYLSKNINLASFLLVNNDFNNKTATNLLLMENLKEIVPFFTRAYPKHPYTKLIQDKYNGIIKIAKGNFYIDVSAMNIEDEKELKLSSLLKDKYILIDMWGSWCGPCIVKTRTMKPLYEKYKESGFNIIGIAREFKSLKAVKNRIKVENYVWPNLYDLDDKYQIWNKYGIGYGTGLMVLVDDKGRILPIDPTAEEVEKIIISN